MQVSTAVDAVISQGGFDSSSTGTSRAVVLSWVNERVQDALGESKWRKQILEIGPTVADQAQYAIPESVVDLTALRVGEGRRWLRVGTEQLFDLQSGDSRLKGAEGAYAPNFEADSDPVVELYPAPTVDGYSIEVVAAVTLSADLREDDTIPLPADLVHDIVIDGAIALGRRRADEREDLAAPYQAIFEKAVQQLSRRSNSRVGSGPSFARIVRPGRI